MPNKLCNIFYRTEEGLGCKVQVGQVMLIVMTLRVSMKTSCKLPVYEWLS